MLEKHLFDYFLTALAHISAISTLTTRKDMYNKRRAMNVLSYVQELVLDED
jgi:hypothetical protein